MATFITENDIGAGLQVVAGELRAIVGATTQTIYQDAYFGRSANGTTSSSTRGLTLTRTAVGRWTVVFTTAHPDGAEYNPSFTAEEQAANRDTPYITVVQGTQNAGGFQLQIVTGDNGATADAYVDTPFSLSVSSPITVVTGVSML